MVAMVLLGVVIVAAIGYFVMSPEDLSDDRSDNLDSGDNSDNSDHHFDNGDHHFDSGNYFDNGGDGDAGGE